ncbi:MAG TPA: hypothetical protein VF469_23085 [Kofleriaceae bacterium]
MELSSSEALEQGDNEHFILDDRNKRQVVAIEIAADELPATVVLHPALRRAQQRMLDVRKGDATLLYSQLPVIVIDLPSVALARERTSLSICWSVTIHRDADLTKRQSKPLTFRHA